MQAVDSSKPLRRWSNRRLLLVVSSLIFGVLVLVLSVVGLARGVGFLLHGVDAVGDVGHIAPERAAPAGNTVPPGTPSTVTETPASQLGSLGTALGPSAQASARPASTAPAGASDGGAEANEASAGPAADAAGANGGGGAGASAGTGGTGGVAGPTPTYWDSVVQSALALLGQTSMCGRNTCNTGQACCNASCGICAAPGSTCDQAQCTGGPRTPTAIMCGSAQCNDGLVCCNASCGTCVAPGGTCSDQKCR